MSAYNFTLLLFLYLRPYKMNALVVFVKKRRKLVGLTQAEFSDKSVIALTVIRKN